MRPRTRTALASILALVLLTASASAVLAATFGEPEDRSYVLPAGETLEDNLFVGAETVRIEGRLDGDLFAGAQSVIIEGEVTGNVFVGASYVEVGEEARIDGDVFGGATVLDIGGRLADDAFLGGYLITLREGAVVGGDLMAGGYAIDLQAGSAVDRQVYAGGNQVALDGTIGSDAFVAGAAVEVDGEIDGDLDVTHASPGAAPQAPPAFMTRSWRNNLPEGADVAWPDPAAPGLRFGSEALVTGDLQTRSGSEVSPPDGVVTGRVDFEEVTEPGAATSPAAARSAAEQATSWLVGFMKEYLALLLVGALAVAIAPGALGAGARALGRKPLPSTGWGCLSLLLVPVALLVLAMALFLAVVVLAVASLGDTLGTLVLSLATLTGVSLTAGVYLLSWLALVAVGLWLGRTLLGGRAGEGPWLSLAAGLFPIALLVTLPIVGGLLRILLVSLGIGGFVLSLYQRRAGASSASDATGASGSTPA